MTYQVADRLKVRTPEGIRELHSGEFVTMTADMAAPLLDQGRIKPYPDKEQTSYDDYIPMVLRTFPGARVVSGKEVTGWKH